MQYKGITTKKDSFGNREEYSFLALAGYTVSKNKGLRAETRQRILSYLMEAGCSKYEIINHLDMLIEVNGSKANMDSARRKWIEDLDYVREYNIDNQRHIRVNAIESGKPKRPCDS